MKKHPWVKEFVGAVTVCDPEGIILEMNDQAVKVFKKQGGAKLLGSNVLHCHPEPARTKLEQLMKHQQQNVYTTEKKGIKRLILQTPWYKEGQYGGFVEISFQVPASMPHFVRDKVSHKKSDPL
jgi:transcriptional regulator with PAS, ATPase and Fis domain